MRTKSEPSPGLDARIVPGPARAIHLHFLVDPSPGRSRGPAPGIVHVDGRAEGRLLKGIRKGILDHLSGHGGEPTIVHPFAGSARGLARAHDLEFEHVFKQAVVAIGPHMGAGFRVNQLTGDPHAPAGFAYRAFEHITHAQFAPDLLHIDGLPSVGKARITGEDRQPADAGECGSDLLDHTIDEILLLRGSPLIFWKGSTAIDGLLANASTGLADGADTGSGRLGPSPNRIRWTRIGRAMFFTR
jgi:hypothetical protein